MSQERIALRPITEFAPARRGPAGARQEAGAMLGPKPAASHALRIGTVVALLVLWELLVAQGWLDAGFTSSPLRIWNRAVALAKSGELWGHTWATLVQLLIGYPIGVVLGLLLAYFFGKYPTVADAFETLITASYGIPKTALAPLFVIWFGIGMESKVAIVVLMTFFLVFFNTYSGLRNIDQTYINLARLMGAPPLNITYRIVLPAVLPHVMVGLRTSVPQAIIGATVGEFIASSAGLGYMVKRAAALFDPGGLLAGVGVLFLMVMIGNSALAWLERRFMEWQPTSEVQLTL